jgi:hypothetical protein
MVGAGARAYIFEKLEPEPHKIGLAPPHCTYITEVTVVSKK